MKVCFASGKGGVGKSMICSCLAYLLKDWLVVDADVDSPTIPIWLDVKWEEIKRLKLARIAVIDEQKCIRCGKCVEVCRFGAIKDFKVDPFTCEGCGACSFICPANAIKLIEVESAELRIGKSKYGMRVVGGRCLPGFTGSGKIVDEVRRIADSISSFQLIDAPAGTGCATISALKGVDLAFLIAEPSQTSLSDLRRVAMLCDKLKVPYKVILNKCDLNEEYAEKIKNEFEVVLELPFKAEVYDRLCELRIPEFFLDRMEILKELVLEQKGE